jgi:hypothetical protein
VSDLVCSMDNFVFGALLYFVKGQLVTAALPECRVPGDVSGLVFSDRQCLLGALSHLTKVQLVAAAAQMLRKTRESEPFCQ